MILDDKGRLFGKVSIIDIFVLIMIAAIILVAYFKFGNTTAIGAKGPEQMVHIKFFTPSVENFTAEVLNEGDIVVNETNNNPMGKVVDIKTGESVMFSPDENGNLIASSLEGYSALEITSEVMGKLNEGSVVINGNLYTTGSEIVIRAGKAKLFLKISGIESVGGN